MRTVEEMRATWEDRRRDLDIARVAERTGYSPSHVSNMVNRRRRMNESVAKEFYRISRNRVDNYTLAFRYDMTVEQVQREFAR